MFEFHAWANIQVEDYDEDLHIIDARKEEAVRRIQQMIEEVKDNVSLFDVKTTGNAMIVFFAHGFNNHRSEIIIDLFRWITNTFPESYGLLYVYDEEDNRVGITNYDNCFRVWKMARGKLSEEDDPHLSPYVPVVERP